MTTKNTTTALILLCCVFFTWGFLTSINSLLVPYAQAEFNLSLTQSMLIQSVFFTSPLLVCMPCVHLIQKVGYRAALNYSLILISIGACFATAAFYTHVYWLLLWAIFVIASGVAMLQVIANPYVVSLGDIHTASQRLTFASTINSLGTTIAPYVTAQLLFTENAIEYIDIILYAMVACFVTLLAFIIRVIKISEPDVIRSSSASTQQRLVEHKHLMFGILALFCYTGVETSIGSLLVNYLTQYADFTAASAAKLVAFYWGGAMIGRLIGSAIFSKVNSRYVLISNTLVSLTIMIGVILYPGSISAHLLIGVGLLNSIMYPVIFSLAVKSLGSYTEKASGFLIMAGLGGATIPLLQSTVANAIELNYSFLIAVICYCIILLYGGVLYKPKSILTDAS